MADFDLISEYYDIIYIDTKGYEDEAKKIIELEKKYNRSPNKHLLDIGCGTGEQMKNLSSVYEVAGLDYSEGMINKAKEKVPDANYYIENMFDFVLEQKYGIAINLFGSIGFAKDYQEMVRGLKSVYGCLEYGGILILTPWDTTETYNDRRLFIDILHAPAYSILPSIAGGLGFSFTFLCVPAGYLAGLLVRRTFGNTYWYLTAVEVVGFAGMLLGGIIMSTWGGFKRRGKTLAVGLFAFGSFAAGMGLVSNFILYLSIMLFYGVALTMVQTAITTILQEKTDQSMQGRVFGLLGTMYAGFLPIGMAIFGPLADIFPLQSIMVGSGIILILIAGAVKFNRQLREI